MQKVLIAGGSGLIGKALTTLLQNTGHQVAWLSRGKVAPEGVQVFNWDVNKGTIDHAAVAWANVLVHLAGEGIAEKRWTSKRKRQIIDSRTQSTALLLGAMKNNASSIHTVIAASAIGFYGQTGANALVEDAQAGKGFLSESVQAWENATAAFAQPGIRLVTLRIGIVLTSKGGALKEIVQTAGLRVLPVFGNGKQIYSWIHLKDVAAIMAFAIHQPISGTFNAVAPNPVTQKQLVAAYGKVKNKWFALMPVPKFGLQLLLGEMSSAILFSQNISAKKISTAGFDFQFTAIETALNDIVTHKN